VLLAEWELGPCGTVGLDAAALALSCVAALADGVPVPGAWLTDPDVIGLVADTVELVAAGEAGHPWLQGIIAIDPEGCPGARELLQARAAEGSGRIDEARLLIGSCLRAAPGLGPAVRDAMEYELCAGNWARAFELGSSLGEDDAIAGPLLRPLDRLREPARGAERSGRNQPCPCGSGRKYKVCCRAKLFI
jgi:SEC-C motif